MSKITLIKPEQAHILKELEQLIGKSIPQVDGFEWNTRGVKIEEENIIGLGLHSCGLTTLPESILQLTSLQTLDLEDNQLTTLPESLGELKSLQKLYLGDNQLTSLPESFGNLKSLQELWVHKNQLRTLPESFGEFKFLQELYLAYNQLRTLPESFGELKSLQKLYLAYNQLRTLPGSFGELKSLQELYLGDNQLTTLPETFGNFKSLEKLELQRNQLRTLPESFGELKSLQELYLGDNEFTTLPEPILQLTSLQTLDLEGNQLTTLPESFGNLKSLEKLELHHNQLRTLPDSFSNLKSLTYLDLFLNKLTTIPDSILQLKNLQSLSLGGNQLTTLPESFGELKSLQELYLLDNQLTTLPGSFWRLQNLTSITLNNNPWEGDSKEMATRDLPTILEFCRKKATINLFISHAMKDTEAYRVIELKNNLEAREEIYTVFICEEATGGIDEFMNEKIPESQLVLFIGTQNSLVSIDCRHELELTLTHGKEIIPIKGTDLKMWDELDRIPLDLPPTQQDFRLSREKGFAFDPEDFEGFCEELYNYIREYKRNINLFESEQAILDKEKLNIKNTINNLFETDEFEANLRINLNQFKELFQELSGKRISPLEYIFRCVEILYKKSKS